jgi:hypothetical protein
LELAILALEICAGDTRLHLTARLLFQQAQKIVVQRIRTKPAGIEGACCADLLVVLQQI